MIHIIEILFLVVFIFIVYQNDKHIDNDLDRVERRVEDFIDILIRETPYQYQRTNSIIRELKLIHEYLFRRSDYTTHQEYLSDNSALFTHDTDWLNAGQILHNRYRQGDL